MQLLQKIFNKGIIPSIEQLYAYISGRMTGADKHQLERTLVDEDLYSDALEGLELMKNQEATDKVTQQLIEKINRKSGIRNNKISILTNIDPKIYLLAASLAFLVGIGFLINHFVKSSEQVLGDNSVSPKSQPSSDETFNEKDYKRMMAAAKSNLTTMDSSAEKDTKIVQENKPVNTLAQAVEKKPVITSDTSAISKVKSNMITGGKKMDSSIQIITESKEEMAEAISDQENDTEVITQPVPSSESVTMKPTAKSAAPSTASNEGVGADRKENSVNEVPAYFPGGKDKLKQYISTNLKYPEKEKEASVTGIVKVSFTVDKKGSIKSTKVIQGVSDALDKEALKLVNNMPAWIPAQKLGEAISSQQSLDIEFK